MAYATFMDVPQELLDRFVGCGPVNYSVYLNACSLVCRSLRSPAQRYLYHRVRLMTTERIDDLLEIIRDNALIATYIRRIYTTSQQLSDDYGLDVQLATLFLRIKEHAPHSSLFLSIIKHPTLPCDQDSTPTRHLTLDGLVHCLAQVHYLDVIHVEEFPSIVLFSFRNLKSLFLHHTGFDPELHAIEQEELLELSAPLRRSLLVLRISNLGYFPSIMVSGIGAQLENLYVKNVRFVDATVNMASPRPQILRISISNHDFGAMKTIVDSLVDFSRLIDLRDGTSPFRYQKSDKESSIQIHRSIQYALQACKDSLQILRLHCMTEAYSAENPQIAFDLSRIPNLHTLILSCHCHDGFDVTTLPMYIRDILRTMNPETSRIHMIIIEIRLLLTRTVPDANGYVRMELPALFQQDGWIQIKEILEALGNKRSLLVGLRVTLMGPFNNNSMMNSNRIVPGSRAEAKLYAQTIARWATTRFSAGTRRWRLMLSLPLLDSSQADGSEPESSVSSDDLVDTSDEDEA
ncbi:hypothetical protein HYPSUDRAFT_72321 [Hypholoma sublateritium FD-334 SS-4]|uniref:F-box domain-containing protein n=1 Tax=Hypholoma sublateritium (strain FD-334 SS-4) TaxID=945553 RepID=A0A0D2KJT4_HYPSF|nr:hypothetical protein HYPSUDRAFT_72321 [Hypholoma sublateritium FD-334 SS-4]